jgi:hypothetical protein
MVPYAEFMNHECSDVYYDFQYLPENSKKSEESEFPEPKELTREELDNATTSDGTYYSEAYESDRDFDYSQDEAELATQNG